RADAGAGGRSSGLLAIPHSMVDRSYVTSLPILLDTDVGTDVDDAIAMALLLAAPELDLRAVTTVSGDVHLRARIAKKLLALGGRGDVPVAAGVRAPVLRQRNFLWLRHDGQAIV